MSRKLEQANRLLLSSRHPEKSCDEKEYFQKKLEQKKIPTPQSGIGIKKPASTYSPALKREVPSAQVGLTSLFEMVRGGPNRHRHRNS